MKKVAPEVRMTEAARKRSAKIRQDKESAENKGPASPRLRTPITQLPRGKNTENRTKELALEENINLLSYIFLIFEITNQMATSMLVADLADEIS